MASESSIVVSGLLSTPHCPHGCRASSKASVPPRSTLKQHKLSRQTPHHSTSSKLNLNLLPLRFHNLHTLHDSLCTFAMTVPSFGDILNLSQTAWRTGRAFTSNRENVPADFQSVEVNMSGLTQALTQLAETLQIEANTTLLSESDQTTKDGIALIFSSCQRTIHDLDSLVDRYQVIRKRRTDSGFAIEQTWSDLVLTQHETVTWTTEGGNLHDLSSLLQMHTKSMELLAEAVTRQVRFTHPHERR